MDVVQPDLLVDLYGLVRWQVLRKAGLCLPLNDCHRLQSIRHNHRASRPQTKLGPSHLYFQERVSRIERIVVNI